MKVKIIAVRHANSGIQVRFETGVGLGLATWSGTQMPRANEEFDVELDIEDQIVLGQNSRLTDRQEFVVAYKDDTVEFKGAIEAQDDNGVAYLRIAADCPIMVESVEDNLKGKWIKISVSVDVVKMTPI